MADDQADDRSNASRARAGRGRTGRSPSWTTSTSGSIRPKRRSRRSRRRRREGGCGRIRRRVRTRSAGRPKNSIRAMMLIRTYRVRGHLAAKLDPLGLHRSELPADLTPEYHGFGPNDLDRPIWIGGALGLRTERQSARSSRCCRRTTAATVGVEYMHINDLDERRFIQDRIERQGRRDPVHARGQAVDPRQGHRSRAVGKVSRAQICRHEKIRARRRRKRGSGARSGDQVWRSIWRRREIDVGMAHRGRLNILVQRDGQALSRDLQRVRGRRDQPGGRRRVGRREVSPRHLARTASSTGSRSICRCCRTRRTSKRSIRSCSARCAPS